MHHNKSMKIKQSSPITSYNRQQQRTASITKVTLCMPSNKLFHQIKYNTVRDARLQGLA